MQNLRVILHDSNICSVFINSINFKLVLILTDNTFRKGMMANNLNLGLQLEILKIGYIAFQADSDQHI